MGLAHTSCIRYQYSMQHVPRIIHHTISAQCAFICLRPATVLLYNIGCDPLMYGRCPLFTSVMRLWGHRKSLEVYLPLQYWYAVVRLSNKIWSRTFRRGTSTRESAPLLRIMNNGEWYLILVVLVELGFLVHGRVGSRKVNSAKARLYRRPKGRAVVCSLGAS